MSANNDIKAYLGRFERIDLSNGTERLFAPLVHEALLTIGVSEAVAIQPEKDPLVRGLQTYTLTRADLFKQDTPEDRKPSDSLVLGANQLAKIGRTCSPQLKLDPTRVAPHHASIRATQHGFSIQAKRPLANTTLYLNPADTERPLPVYNPRETVTDYGREWLRDCLLDLVPDDSTHASFHDIGLPVDIRIVDDPKQTTKAVKLTKGNLENFPELRIPNKVKERTILIRSDGTELKDTPADKIMRSPDDRAIIDYLPPTPLLRKQFDELASLIDALDVTWR